MTEQVLLKKLKRKEEDAFEEVVNTYANKLFKVCYLILKDEKEAEDVVQETFIKVFKNISSFRGDSSIYTWIYRIALNISRDVIRKRQEFLSFKDEWVGEDDVEETVEHSIDREILRSSLESLNHIYSECLILYYFEDLSIKEISEVLEESEGTIKSKLSRGRKLLKSSLEKGGQFNE
ncbi:MAG: sigma-70 family RNA polymerase sigma factor [Clostridia bacterium]|nr:sigma-70 family RNA polymerase sigma factor [Clostridia bacterium]